MTDPVITAIIAASSVLLGGLLTGIIALINQRMALKAADRKAQLEIADRDRTRFHDARKEAYAEFLTAVSDASGRVTFEVVERLEHGGYGPVDIVPRPGFENFDSDAPMRMMRQQSIVRIISGSPEVRQASVDLVDSVVALVTIRPGADISEAINAALRAQREAHERFVDAANKELARLTDDHGQ